MSKDKDEDGKEYQFEVFHHAGMEYCIASCNGHARGAQYLCSDGRIVLCKDRETFTKKEAERVLRDYLNPARKPRLVKIVCKTKGGVDITAEFGDECVITIPEEDIRASFDDILDVFLRNYR